MSDSPVISSLLREIVRINPLQSSFIDSSLDDISAEELGDLEQYLEFCAQRSLDIDYLAECYDVIVKDTLREQMFFQRHRKYRYSTFAEVADAVYFDDEYMSKYMYGLAITSWLWPNHRQMHRCFAHAVPTGQAGNYLEIGPGHGVYMLTAMNLSSYGRFETRTTLDRTAHLRDFRLNDRLGETVLVVPLGFGFWLVPGSLPTRESGSARPGANGSLTPLLPGFRSVDMVSLHRRRVGVSDR